ncbi:beta-phosphoglucomutase family hydrolase [Reinekea marinisedimentorum]|uniref:HAD superfamily hydrolase (TIGR01509 family)/beta-phosphoglucomutase family hydrolase n=1 Tax=Reinekea marinisedimentorum TaxID=230495 RepID=A0A4R3IEJ7_9GAMM|nr:beta-phosphoglucomutase family hydrolase [Reinekea marinisedimentorum]TCS44028.1 HAD superfamily hydrolase (TIGR01509 family)/beta-phosphoglucomutase family hydrolase [Reinekea marinisedimentorum]
MIETVENYQGIIFDMDGTLIDSMPYHLDAWKTAAEAFEFPYDREWLNSMGGMPSAKIVVEINQRYGISLDPKEVTKLKMATYLSFEFHGEPIAVTNDILNHFVGKKRIAVGTGSPQVQAHKLLEESGIMPKLDAVVTATDVSNHKPNPDTFLLAAEKLQLLPEHCVVFEDTHLGKQAAHSAGMDCIMVEGDALAFYPAK